MGSTTDETAGFPLTEVGPEKIAELRRGQAYLRGWGGAYAITFTSAGVEQFSIYPTPTSAEAGLRIFVYAVVEPAELTDSNKTLVVPGRFRFAPVDYACAIAFSLYEDNPELRAFHQEAFDRAVADLNILRLSRESRGGVQLQVEGWHY